MLDPRSFVVSEASSTCRRFSSAGVISFAHFCSGGTGPAPPFGTAGPPLAPYFGGSTRRMSATVGSPTGMSLTDRKSVV